jgi:hypothetical protein
MSDPEQIALLTEIRDLQRRQIEFAERTIAHQEQSLKNQELSLANQQRAIDKQLTNQQGLIKARRWSQILLAVAIAGVFLYLLQPLLFLFFARPPR